MDKYGIALFVFLAGTAIPTASAQSCNACNCQFNNVQVLDQLVEAKVKSALASEPRKLLLYSIMTLFKDYYLCCSLATIAHRDRK